MESGFILSHVKIAISSPLPPTFMQRYRDSPPVLNPTGRSAINVVTRDAAAFGRPSTGTRIRSELDPSVRSTNAVRGSILIRTSAGKCDRFAVQPDGDRGRAFDHQLCRLSPWRDDRGIGVRGILRVSGDQGRQVGQSFGVGVGPSPREIVALAIGHTRLKFDLGCHIDRGRAARLVNRADRVVLPRRC